MGQQKAGIRDYKATDCGTISIFQKQNSGKLKAEIKGAWSRDGAVAQSGI